MVGIIAAMDLEFELIKNKLTDIETEKTGGVTLYKGKYKNNDVVCAVCGMGKVFAAMCTEAMIIRYSPKLIINTGVAGALSSELDIGDLVVSTDAVQHDADVSALGFRKGEILYTGMTFFPADEELREKAVKAISLLYPDFSLNQGRICSGDQFIHSLEQKKTIVSEFGGLCCDMEGAAIAQVCWLYGIPWVVLRAISDKVDGTGDEQFESFADLAAHCSASVVLHMLAEKNGV